MIKKYNFTKKKVKNTLTKKIPNTNKKVKIIILKYLIPEKSILKKEGHFFNEKDYKTIINTDCDVYGIDENNNKICLFKFRKSVIPNNICKQAYKVLEKQAQHFNDNRGAAAGLIKKSQLPLYVNKITNLDKFRVNYKDKKGITRKSHLSNRVRSNIIGYYDMPDRNVLKRDGKAPKCRQTAFTRDEVEKWKNACPIFIEANKQFKKLMPTNHKIQLKQCSKTPKFQIKNTAFSTITINYNYRSALHKDSGDLESGFGNLMVLEKNKCINNNFNSSNPSNPSNPFNPSNPSNPSNLSNKNKIYDYKGGYLGMPKYGIAVNVRQGDYLAMNVHEWHCNCKIICGCPKGKLCKKGVEHHGRLSLVCYLRKNMIKCIK